MEPISHRKDSSQSVPTAGAFPSLSVASNCLPLCNPDCIPSVLSSTIKAGCEYLREWIGSDPDSRQINLGALRNEIEFVISQDDSRRKLAGNHEDKVHLLDADYFFKYSSKDSLKIPKIEKEWIRTFISLAVATLADYTPDLPTLRKLDSTIRTFNQTYPKSGWNFSLILFQQLCLNRFEIGDPLRAALRLSGRGTKQPGEYGYRMAAMTLFLLGMHIKSSLPNELEYDLRPMKSLSLATEAVRNPLNLHFQTSVPKDLQSAILNNLKTGLQIFLFSSSKFWKHKGKVIAPLQEYLDNNKDFVNSLIEEASARKKELSSIFVHAGSFWLHSNIFKTRTLPAPTPGTWDEILLSPNEGVNIFWYRVILDGYIPEFLFQTFKTAPELFLHKNTEAYNQWSEDFQLFKEINAHHKA